jgi:hypothetical protein
MIGAMRRIDRPCAAPRSFFAFSVFSVLVRSFLCVCDFFVIEFLVTDEM